MSKIVWVVAIISMIMTTGILASAAEQKGEPQGDNTVGSAGTGPGANVAAPEAAADKGKPGSESIASGKAASNDAAGREYLLRAWGKYGPIYVPEGASRWYRIFYPGAFLGQPSVVDSLAIPYPSDIYTSYSLGRDRAYSYNNRFDARIYVYSGSLNGAYIDWVAIRG